MSVFFVALKSAFFAAVEATADTVCSSAMYGKSVCKFVEHLKVRVLLLLLLRRMTLCVMKEEGERIREPMTLKRASSSSSSSSSSAPSSTKPKQMLAEWSSGIGEHAGGASQMMPPFAQVV